MYYFLRRTLCLAFLISTIGPPAWAFDWPPLDPAHLAMQAPRVQPDADAEAIVWEVRVADSLDVHTELTTTFEHYVRLKIFTERGREKFATVDIPYSSGMDVKDVAARTTRPDGTSIELKGADIYRRTVVKAGDLKVKMVSFAVPGIQQGAIVEYRWKEVYRDSLAANLRLPFSREVPVHTVKYLVRPLKVPGLQMKAWPFNGNFSPPVRQNDGYTVITLSDVRADIDVEYGPPAFERRPWVFITYEAANLDTKNFARDFGKALFEEYGKRAKPNDEIRRLASEATTGTASDMDRLSALARAARQKLRRVDVDTATDEDRRQAKNNKNAADALKRGLGTEDDAVLLLMALAGAAGFDARVAAVPDRGDLFQRSVQSHPYFLRGRLVAVKSGDGWLFADPGNEYAASGELRWQFEDQRALVADPRAAVFARTALSPAAYSVKKRTGTFRLSEDGTLEGDVRLEFTGHWADTFREQEDQDTAADWERDLRESVQTRLPGAEVTEVHLENVTNAAGTYVNRYTLRVPGYAQRTGSRLFVQAAFFQKGLPAIFAPLERSTEVYFPFAWREDDTVRISLPAGYTLEAPEKPASFDAGAVAYNVNVTLERGSVVVLQRTMLVGNGGGLLFDAKAYRPLRAAFDAVHRSDGHTLVLRRPDLNP